MNLRLPAVMVVASMLCALAAYPCKTTRSVSNVDMVREADAILRVRAEEYAPAPTNQKGFEPDSNIRFKVLEVVRGQVTGDHLVLPGILVDSDDYNDRTSPYNLVRPDGRRGSCFASSYRSRGEFLLMLKKKTDREFTLDWYPLAPVNEQLHSVSDPWLMWVREQAQGPSSKSTAHD